MLTDEPGTDTIESLRADLAKARADAESLVNTVNEWKNHLDAARADLSEARRERDSLKQSLEFLVALADELEARRG